MTDYTWENLNSREFEVVACNYANDIFPNYSWMLTNPTKDDNHDFEAVFDNFEKWGEAKHSENPHKSMSRSQWDPTIVSARLINSVNEVLLVTCSDIPLTYVIRSFHMIENSLEKVFFANRILLNKWYGSDPKLLNFDSEYPIESITEKIHKKNLESKASDTLKIFCFNQIDRNYLTPLKEVHNKSVYEIDIVFFSSEMKGTVFIPVNDSIKCCSDIYIYNTSFPGKSSKTVLQNGSDLRFDVTYGFNIVELNIVINRQNSDNNKILFSVFLNGKKHNKSFIVLQAVQSKIENIIQFEKEVNKIDSAKNSILHIEYLPIDSFKRYNKNYYYIRFDEREKYNYSKLCQIILHLITGIDFVTIDESVLRNTIIKYENYLILEDFVLGTYDSLWAYECLNNQDKAKSIFRVLRQRQESKNFFYIIENPSLLSERGHQIIKEIESNYILHQNNNVIIFQENTCSTQINAISNNVALIVFFEDGVDIKHISEENNNQNSTLIYTDIDGRIAYPNYSYFSYHQFCRAIEYLHNKRPEGIYDFFGQLISIISTQSNSNRVLDSLTFLRHRFPSDILLQVLRRIRDIYYDKTDFWNAYGYSKLIISFNNHSPIKDYIDDIYKEADELNHCGSIMKSRERFSLVVKLIDENQLDFYLSKKIEAQTEIYNISFWLLDTDGLINRIENTIAEYYPKGVSSIKTIRGQYPYYNCLNRKMVTEYLLELYEDAEKSFQLCLKESKLNNYIAFAYMDSARGLYKKNIQTAYIRLKKAFEILCILKESHRETRRYYDCSVEIAYVRFVLADNTERESLIFDLQDRVYDIKKNGLHSMAKKCYFKLAACYLVLGKIKQAKVYLDIIHNDKDFSNCPRNQLMYNSLQFGYYYLLNKKGNYYSNKEFKAINFNCFERKQRAELYIETRLW